jgi:integrase
LRTGAAILTPKRIAKLRRRPGRYPDGSGLGLYLQVVNENSASWVLRFVRHGKEYMLGLGSLRIVGLKEARLRAKAARLQLLDDINPVEERKRKKVELAIAAAKTMTFADAARQYHAQHENKWRNSKHRQQYLDTLQRFAFPVFGTLPVGAIDTGLVLKVLEPMWTSRMETARRLRGRIESVLDWATVRNYRQGDNPARWKGHLSEVLPGRTAAPQAHHPALPYPQVPAFVAQLRERSGVAARALEFTILTAARSGEVLGAKWEEIDFAAKMWTIPPARMKGHRQHRVPLSGRILDLLRGLPTEEGNDFIFIGGRQPGLSSTAMTETLKALRPGGATVHGFRSSFRDWAAEQTATANFVVEAALAHIVADKVEAAYRRGDLFEKRRRLMDQWARYLARPATAGSVVPVRSADA